MTELLAKALHEIAQLPDTEQDRIAALILAELEDERLWDAQFAASQDALAAMADKARQNYRTGLTEPLDPETL